MRGRGEGGEGGRWRVCCVLLGVCGASLFAVHYPEVGEIDQSDIVTVLRNVWRHVCGSFSGAAVWLWLPVACGWLMADRRGAFSGLLL